MEEKGEDPQGYDTDDSFSLIRQQLKLHEWFQKQMIKFATNKGIEIMLKYVPKSVTGDR